MGGIPDAAGMSRPKSFGKNIDGVQGGEATMSQYDRAFTPLEKATDSCEMDLCP